jgi:hypothetical protein
VLLFCDLSKILLSTDLGGLPKFLLWAWIA